jgi:hypothetical protein
MRDAGISSAGISADLGGMEDTADDGVAPVAAAMKQQPPANCYRQQIGGARPATEQTV